MARPNVRLAMLLVLSMLVAGCTSSSTPEWGTGDGQVSVDIDADDESATIESQLGGGYEDTVTLPCDAKEATITGMLISSQIYDSHPDIGEGDVNSAMGAAVIIHIMKWSEAESVKEGSAERVSIKSWSMPTNPEEGGGSNKISNNEKEWAVIGIIPASENIADGLNVLEHWHQPIELTGYIITTDNVAGLKDCQLEEQGHGMIVTNIKTEQGVVSLDGEDDDEYSLGDTDFFGRWTFILFFLIVGIGGGVGLFMVSTMVIRQGARATAEALLGREGFAKAVQMKEDLKSSKRAGLESASDRAAKQRENNPPPKKTSQEDEQLAGFSLDSVLSSSTSDDGPTKFGSGSSVVVTSEAKQMQSQPVINSAPIKVDNTPMPSSNVVSSNVEPAKRGHFSASMSRSQISSQPNAKPPVKERAVKKRSVKKRATKAAPEPEPEPVVKERRASVSDDEEFSDFSF